MKTIFPQPLDPKVQIDLAGSFNAQGGSHNITAYYTRKCKFRQYLARWFAQNAAEGNVADTGAYGKISNEV
jgi:hypothetical protein